MVIGGGAAGLTSSGICAGFGAKTALVERHRLGGDCTWSGCVPSKSLLHVAKIISQVRKSAALGVTVGGLSVDFARVMDTVRSRRQKVYEEADSPEVMQARGVTVLPGSASFVDGHALAVKSADGERHISFRSAIITAGGAPLILPIPGLDKIDFLTNETIFELKEQPEHLVVLGNGPIGVEMAQAFNLLGTKVTVVALDPHILVRDEEKCALLLQERLQNEGITFYNGETIHSVEKKSQKYVLAVGPLSGVERSVECDHLLVAVGRVPNLAQLNLENAGIKVVKNGIPVDKYCRTNQRHIFAAGDITTFLKFTHVAENMAKTAAVNALLHVPLYKYEQEIIPWVTYTSPECAHVGKTAEELQEANRAFRTIEFPYHKIDRAVTEHAGEGWIIVHMSPAGKILGAHAVGIQAGEIIGEYALAMKNGLKLADISNTIHAYPTMLLGARRAADQYYVRLQKRWMAKLVRTLFRYRGEIPAYVGSNEVL